MKAANHVHRQNPVSCGNHFSRQPLLWVRLRKESVVNGFIGHRVDDGVVDRWWASNPRPEVGGLDWQDAG